MFATCSIRKCFQGSWGVVEGMENMFEGILLGSLWCVMPWDELWGYSMAWFFQSTESARIVEGHVWNPQAANRNEALPLEKALDALTYVQIELLDVLVFVFLGFDRWVGVDCRLRLWPCMFWPKYTYVYTFIWFMCNILLYFILFYSRFMPCWPEIETKIPNEILGNLIESPPLSQSFIIVLPCSSLFMIDPSSS